MPSLSKCLKDHAFERKKNQKTVSTFVTLGLLSLCQTATSCGKAALSAAASASVLWPSSPQSSNFTENKNATKEKGNEHYSSSFSKFKSWRSQVKLTKYVVNHMSSVEYKYKNLWTITKMSMLLLTILSKKGKGKEKYLALYSSTFHDLIYSYILDKYCCEAKRNTDKTCIRSTLFASHMTKFLPYTSKMPSLKTHIIII